MSSCKKDGQWLWGSPGACSGAQGEVCCSCLVSFQSTLNALMAAGREAWTEARSYLQQLLSTGRLTNVNGYVTLITSDSSY